jgi:hypothetical protein
MSKRTLLFSSSLIVGLGAALLLALFHPGIGGAGDTGSIPEVAAGVEMIPAQGVVSSVFDEGSSAPKLSTSSEVQHSASLEKAASDLSAPQAGVPNTWLPGNADLSRAHALMTGLGTAHRMIYAYPTDKGKLCAGLTGVSSGCLPGFFKNAPIDWTFIPPNGNEPALVWGIAPDSIEQVGVIVDGVTHIATLENNAYFFQAPTTNTVAFDALIINLADGSTRTVPLPSEDAITGGAGDIKKPNH